MALRAAVAVAVRHRVVAAAHAVETDGAVAALPTTVAATGAVAALQHDRLLDEAVRALPEVLTFAPAADARGVARATGTLLRPTTRAVERRGLQTVLANGQHALLAGHCSSDSDGDSGVTTQTWYYKCGADDGFDSTNRDEDTKRRNGSVCACGDQHLAAAHWTRTQRQRQA